MDPSPVSCANPPFFAPPFNAWIALPDNAPKLIAETLKMLALYGCVQLGAEPMVTRKSAVGISVGTNEWLIHS